MANARASGKKPTISGEERANNGAEYHLNVENNSGYLIAGHNNTISTYNVYNVLRPSRNNNNNNNNNNKKKTNKHKRTKKKKRPERLESDGVECSNIENSAEPGKGEQSGKDSPRKVSFLNEFNGDSSEQSHDDEGLKTNNYDQEFITTSEDESPEHLATQDAAEKTNILKYRLQSKENSLNNNNLAGPSKSESECGLAHDNKSGNLFSPFMVAVRQSICFAACIMFCLYFEVSSYIPFLFWLIFVGNNLLACFSCITFRFKTIDYRDIPPEIDNERPFIAIARLQVDFFIKEENTLQRLFALLLCVSLAFVSSQVFGCATCSWMQTIVVTIVSTSPYLLFKNNDLLPSVLAQHCRVFKAGLEASGNPLR